MKKSLDLFSHLCKAVKVEGFLLFQKLHRHIAVGLDFCFRQMLGMTKSTVIPQHTVVRQRKALSLYTAQKGMIVKILLRAALRRHARMSHDDVSLRRNTQMQPMRRQRTLVNLQPTRCVVGDAGGIGAARFCRDREPPG